LGEIASQESGVQAFSEVQKINLVAAKKKWTCGFESIKQCPDFLSSDAEES
jgi:hypothetical protein